MSAIARPVRSARMTTRAFGAGEQLLGFLGIAAIVAIAAAYGGWITNLSLDSWYLEIDKPSWTPSGALIGAVWSVLYLLMAVAAWLVWRRDGFARAGFALSLFGLQLALNVLWTGLFFGAQAPGAAFAEIIVLWFAILATATAFWRHSRAAALLMLPYLAWVAFASFLTFMVWRLN